MATNPKRTGARYFERLVHQHCSGWRVEQSDIYETIERKNKEAARVWVWTDITTVVLHLFYNCTAQNIHSDKAQMLHLVWNKATASVIPAVVWHRTGHCCCPVTFALQWCGTGQQQRVLHLQWFWYRTKRDAPQGHTEYSPMQNFVNSWCLSPKS